MAVKRDKVLKDAEKLVQKGKLDQAIREYEKILRRFPNDTTIINRVGDLYGRVGQLQRSIELYEEIAEHFTKDGFTTKAIAILKKIQRLDPQRLDIFERLAELYFQQNLIVEAKREYQILADWYVKNGELEKAIDAHEKLVNLDPGNHISALRLADLLLRRGETGSAIKVYDRLGNMLLEAGKLDEAERLYRHVLGQNPPEGEFLAKICVALLDAGRTPLALEFLNFAIKHSPDSVELKILLTRAHLSTGEVEESLRLAKEVLAVEPKNARIRALMGDALVSTGEVGEAREMLVPTIRELLEKRDHRAAQASLKELLKQFPKDQEVLQLAVRAWAPSDDQEFFFTLRAALAESYFNTGELAGAKRLYLELLQTQPDNELFRERLASLDDVNEQYFKPAHELAAGDEVIEDVVEVEAIEEVELTPPPAPIAGPGTKPEPVVTVEPVVTPDPVVEPKPVAKPEPVTPPPAFDLKERMAEAAVFAKYGLVEKAISHLEDVVLFCPDELEPRKQLAMLYAEHGDREAAVSMATPVVEHHRLQGTEDRVAGLLAAIPELGDGPPVKTGRGSLADEEVTHGESMLADPSGIEFVDEDSDLIEVVDVESGAFSGEDAAAGQAVDWEHESPVEQAPPLGSAETEAADQPAAVEFGPEPAGSAPVHEQETADELVEITDSFIGPSMGDLEQIDFFIDQELFDDAARLLSKLEEEHPEDEEVARRRLRLKDVGVFLEQVETVEEGAEELFADEEQYIDLAKELEAELAAEEAMVDEATGRGKGEALLEEVFREFQKGVAEQLSEEDSDTHFNLGIAYREMGLLPEAIREFQVASRDKSLFVESCSIIGVCYQEQGMWSEAASWYQKALVAPGISEDARLGLRYDLAIAYEAAGDSEQAFGILTEILAVNPAYRDVSDRLSTLSEQRQAN
ncbi:MAG TPA: tetratricopeptide repeat protein, partial [Chondromyces sp.]|nr:tetratricopeptide repeat protein [Chondromyces sp.]